jgi:glycerol-3-phosphate dehydrogenase
VNYVEARRLLTSNGHVRGVVVAQAGGRVKAELRAPVVINAAGPWAGALAATWGAADDRLSPLVVAWNVLLDRPPLSGHAVALQDPSSRGALKFATSLGGRLLVGTGYSPLRQRCEAAESVADDGLDAFLAAVNRCVPRLEATRRDVLRVFSGVLPAAAPGSSQPRARNLLLRHGPDGLFTISGTKFTTARSAARRALAAVRRSGALRKTVTAASQAYPPCDAMEADGLFGDEWTMLDLEARRPALARMIEHEAVEHLDDLTLRRTTLGDQPVRALTAARALCSLDARWQRAADREVARLASRLGWRNAAWPTNEPCREAEALPARTA